MTSSHQERTPYSADDLAREVDVSRETLDRLALFVALLQKWQPAINLVSRKTLSDVWRRHILDSAQLYALVPDSVRSGRGTCVDLGSGGGFPGLVLSIMGLRNVHLVESDSRKCQFLREANRICGAEATVINARIEAVTPFPADVITARALAPLDRLLDMADQFVTQDTVLLFLKGQDVDSELTKARKIWTMDVEHIASKSDPDGTILRIRHLHRPIHV